MAARTLVSLMVVVAMLAVPAAAGAKGVEDAQACGASGCVAALTPDTYLIFEGGPGAPPPAAREPFYELRYRMMTGDGPEPEMVPMRMLYVPGARLLRGEDGVWMRPDRRAAEALRRHLTGVEPFPAARLDLSSRQAASDPQPGPMDLRTPGQEPDSATGGGLDAGPAIGIGLALVLIVAGAALAAGSRRRRRPAAG